MPGLLKRFVSASRGRRFSPTPRASDQEHFISQPSPLPSSQYAHAGRDWVISGVLQHFRFFQQVFVVYYKQIERSRTLCPASAPDFFKISHISLNLSKLKDFFNLLVDDPLRTYYIPIDPHVPCHLRDNVLRSACALGK